MTETTGKPETRRRFRFGGVGLIVALFAFAAAVLSPWIVEAVEPAKPIDEVAVDIAVRIKDRLVAKAKGKEFVPPPAETRTFAVWYPAGTISLGVFAMCCGVIGFVRHEDLRINGSAVSIGIAAIVFQYFLILASVVILLLLVGLILSALGISL